MRLELAVRVLLFVDTFVIYRMNQLMAACKTGALTAKAQRFVEEYLSDGKLNGTQAAIRAGYSPPSAHSMAAELLDKPEIKKAVEARMAELAERCAISVESITKQLTDAYELAMCGVVDRGADKPVAIANASPAAAVAAAMGLAKLHGLIVDKKADTTADGKPLPPAVIRIVHVRPDDPSRDT